MSRRLDCPTCGTPCDVSYDEATMESHYEPVVTPIEAFLAGARKGRTFERPRDEWDDRIRVAARRWLERL